MKTWKEQDEEFERRMERDEKIAAGIWLAAMIIGLLGWRFL